MTSHVTLVAGQIPTSMRPNSLLIEHNIYRDGPRKYWGPKMNQMRGHHDSLCPDVVFLVTIFFNFIPSPLPLTQLVCANSKVKSILYTIVQDEDKRPGWGDINILHFVVKLFIKHKHFSGFFQIRFYSSQTFIYTNHHREYVLISKNTLIFIALK